MSFEIKNLPKSTGNKYILLSGEDIYALSLYFCSMFPALFSRPGQSSTNTSVIHPFIH